MRLRLRGRNCSGDVAQITKAQHEAWKRGEFTPAPADPPALPPADDGIVDAEVVEKPPDVDARHADRLPVPDWAEPPPASRTGQLVPLEQATAETAQANRAAKVSHARRKRR